MSEEKCSYYYVDTGYREKSPMVILLCNQLDEIGVTYTLRHREGDWCFGPDTHIIFDKEQNRAWIEANVYPYYRSSLDDYDYTVDIIYDNLIECDDWLLENFGLIEDKWTAGFSGDTFNTYYFKNDTDVIAFKLKFS